MKTLGKYELLEEIASGGMGKICRGRDRVLHREVAIKTIFTGQTDPQLKQRFYREARACAALSHPNIITVFDLGEQQGISYIAMELLEGEDLRRFIDRRAVMSLEAKIDFMCEVCDGLAHAHENGILHRDIKPGNIFIVRSGRPKILDFGVARIAASNLTLPGTTPGTPRYMSPEQYLGNECDALSDLFSAAVVFFEFLTYVHPFDGPAGTSRNSMGGISSGRPTAKWAAHEVPCRVLEEEPLTLRGVNPAMPQRLEKILAKGLSKDAKARYQTARELAKELKKVTVDLMRECSRLWNEVLESRKRILEIESKLGDYLGTSWMQTALKEGNIDLTLVAKIEPEASATTISNLHYLELTTQLGEIKRIENFLVKLSEDLAKTRQDTEAAAALLAQGNIEGAASIARPLSERFPDHAQVASLMREIVFRSSAAALEKALSENNLASTLELLNNIQATESMNPEEVALVEALRSRAEDALAAKDMICESLRATLGQLQNASTEDDIQRIETLVSSLGDLARELEKRYAGSEMPSEIQGLLSSCAAAQLQAKLRVSRFNVRAALTQGDLKAVRQSLHAIKDLCTSDSRYENQLLEAQREVVEAVLVAPYAPSAAAPAATFHAEEPTLAAWGEARSVPDATGGEIEAATIAEAGIPAMQADRSGEVQPGEKAELAGLQRLLHVFQPRAKKRARSEFPAAADDGRKI